MPLNLNFSNSIEPLLDNLSGKLYANWQDPFCPATIVAPGRNLEKWIKLRFTDEKGCAAGLRFDYIEDFLWDRLSPQYEKHTGIKTEMLAVDRLELFILGILKECRKTTPPELNDVYKYLTGNGGSLNPGKLVQFSAKCASLFLEYEYNRPTGSHGPALGVMDQWPGKPYFYPRAKKEDKGTVERTEKWQRYLYGRLFAENGVLENCTRNTGIRLLTLPGLWKKIREEKVILPNGPDAHIFCLPFLSIFHMQVIHGLAQNSEIHVYALNPCSDFWEDEPGRRTKQSTRWEKPSEKGGRNLVLTDQEMEKEELDGLAGPGLLSLWGQAIKENVLLWCRAVEYNFEFLVNRESSAPATVLQTLRDMMLTRENTLLKTQRIAQDPSLQVLACPEIYREIETIHNSILENLERDPSLQLTDIQILMPDPTVYRTAFHRVFNRTEGSDSHCVPYVLTDGGESWYGQGIRRMLDLMTGPFSRREIFDLFRNPLFQAAQNIDLNTLRTWEAWCRDLNIFHGYNKEHRSKTECEPEELHTWTHGIRRLLLGRIAETKMDFPGGVPFSGAASEEDETLEKFIRTIESLYSDISAFSTHLAAGTWQSAAEMFGNLMNTWLDIPAQHSKENTIRTSFFHALRNLRILDDLKGTAPVELEAFQALVSGFSSRNLPAGANYCTGGIMISAIDKAPPVPCRITYLAGLGAGNFPASTSAFTLDLRNSRRMIGDLSPNMRDRTRFLEILMQTKDRLYLSYLSYNSRKEEDLQPSAVIMELESFLNHNVLVKPFQRTAVPLLSHDSALIPENAEPSEPRLPRSFLPTDAVLFELEQISSEFPQALADGRMPAALLQKIRNMEPAQYQGTLAEHLCPPGFFKAGAAERNPVNRVPLKWITEYLSDPLSFTLRRHLNLWDDDYADTSLEEDEPFYSDTLPGWNIRNRFVHTCVEEAFINPDTGTSPEQDRRHLYKLYEEARQIGQTAEGLYGNLDRDELFEKTKPHREGINNLKNELEGYTLVRNGTIGDFSGRPDKKADRRFKHACVSSMDRDILLSGTTDYLFLPPADNPDMPVAILVATASDYVKTKHLLAGFLFYLAGLLSPDLNPLLAGRGLNLYKIDKRKTLLLRNHYPATPTDTAEKYLAELAVAAGEGSDYDHIPLEAVDDLCDKKTGTATINREAINAWLEAQHDNSYSNYRPLEILRLFNPEVPADADKKVQQRLSPFYNGSFK